MPLNTYQNGQDPHQQMLTRVCSNRSSSSWLEEKWMHSHGISYQTKHACVCALMLSRCTWVRLCGTPWTAACQAPLSVGLSRPEYWSGLPCPPLQGTLWTQGLNPGLFYLLHCLAGSLPRAPSGKPKSNIFLQYNATIMILNIYQNELNNYPHNV